MESKPPETDGYKDGHNLLEENLALRPGVRITASVAHPTGDSAPSPDVLLNESARGRGDGPLSTFDPGQTYCTYDGQNAARGDDWYAIDCPDPVRVNCIEMTMGFPYRDGGWWTSLHVEARLERDGPWRCVERQTVTPTYLFADTREGRRPFATHVLTFEPVCAHAIRLVGRAGGSAEFTSLARLAVYHRDLSRWNALDIAPPPVPRLFRLIPPHVVAEMSEHLAELTGLTIDLPLMEYYLPDDLFGHYWRRVAHNYHGQPELWFLIGNTVGWAHFKRLSEDAPPIGAGAAISPYVHTIFHDTLGYARAPIIVDGAVIGEMTTTQPVIVRDDLDLEAQRRYADDLGIPWREYEAALARSLHLTRAQLKAAAALMGTIANTIATLAHDLDVTREALEPRPQRHRETIRRAIDYMERHLDDAVTVSTVARAVALSPTYFCAVFTAQTGHTPSDYLIRLRVERAKEYLAHTDMSVMDVCAALHCSPSYFSRLFKQRTGYTPAHYARQMREVNTPPSTTAHDLYSHRP